MQEPPVFSKYDLLDMLRDSELSRTYKVRHRVLGRTLMLKQLAPGLLHSDDDFAWFQRETEALGQLQHPHIVSLYDAGIEDAVPFIVTEFVEGQSLDRLSSRKEGMPVEKVVQLGREIASALAHMHERGIVHRDVRPSKIMQTSSGDFLLNDFSLLSQMHLTRIAADFGGTYAYMSPEQVEGSASEQSDQYGLGVVLFGLLARQRPFYADGKQGPADRQLAHLIVHVPPPRVRMLRPELPPWLDEAVARCLNKNPQERFPDMRALEQALAAGAEQHEEVPPTDVPLTAVPLTVVADETASDRVPLAVPPVADVPLADVPLADVPLTVVANETGSDMVPLAEPPVAEKAMPHPTAGRLPHNPPRLVAPPRTSDAQDTPGAAVAYGHARATPAPDRQKRWYVLGLVAVLAIVILGFALAQRLDKGKAGIGEERAARKATGSTAPGERATPVSPDRPAADAALDDAGAAQPDEQATAAAPPAQADDPWIATSAVSELSEADARQLADSYLHQSATNPGRILDRYADRVVYYDRGEVERRVVLQDKQAYLRRWPERTYTRTSAVDVRAEGDKVRIRFSYRYEVGNSTSTGQGQGWSELTLDSRGDRLYIVGEKGGVL